MTPRPPRAPRAGAALLRLLVVLALGLFGLSQGHAGAAAARPGPAAHGEAEQVAGILTASRLALRAPLAEDDKPDIGLPGGAVQPVRPYTAAPVLPVPPLSFQPVALRILPPVRGPPAV